MDTLSIRSRPLGARRTAHLHAGRHAADLRPDRPAARLREGRPADSLHGDRHAANVDGSRPAAGGAPSWLTLQPGMAVGLELAPGDRVQVLAGRVWLTEPGDAADHFVGAGQCHLLRHGGRVVLECDGACAARMRLEPTRRARRGPLQVAARRGLPRVAPAFGLGLRRLRCWLGRLAG